MDKIRDCVPVGVTFVTDRKGKVTEIIDDQMQLFTRGNPIDRYFTDYLDRGSKKKGLQMVKEVGESGAVYNCEIHVKRDDEPQLLTFSGIETETGLLLIGSTGSDQTEFYLNGLMEMNNEHVNRLRLFLKEKKGNTQTKENSWELYNEMSRLNNELSNTQRNLFKKKKELERLNELKNRMMGMAAHDLRSPLTVIQNFSAFLKEDHEQEPCFTEQQYQMLSEIQKSSDHMIHIIEDMLDISAIESGSINLKKEPCNLCSLVERAVSMNQPSAQKKDIGLETDFPEDPVVQDIDPHKFEQVMSNLLSNAIKYSHSGTTVTVGLQKHAEKGTITVFVKDQGQGIPPEELGSLFKPFSKTSVEPTAGEKSTGLGLAIAKKIIEAHGGRIRVESQPGKGTTFYIELPGGAGVGSLIL